MRDTLTVRLPEDLAEWLDDTAKKTGTSQGRIIRDQLQSARESEVRSFLSLAGKVSLASNLSTRKGFSKR